MSELHIDSVRRALMDTLADLRNRDNPMDLERAKTVAAVASVVVDTVKVENDYLKISGHNESKFLTDHGGTVALPKASAVPTAHNPFPVTKTHRLGS